MTVEDKCVCTCHQWGNGCTVCTANQCSAVRPPGGSKDGDGCGDHDVPFTFGRRLNSKTHEARGFSERQYARLLIFKSTVEGLGPIRTEAQMRPRREEPPLP